MKRKVNINRPSISAEEIAKGKNFSELAKMANPVDLPFYKSSWFATSIAGVSLVVALVAFHYINQEKEISELKPKIEKVQKQVEESTLISYNEDTPCIKPPSEKLSIKGTSYMVNNSKGKTITHPSGTTIEIPKNAFIKDGKLVEGEVEIRYKEFKDQIDILLSGIPMHYDSANTDYVLESAGMVQIYGFQNNLPVDIKNGKSIKINFPTQDPSSRFNLYELDTIENKWDFKGKPTVNRSKEKINKSKPTISIVDAYKIESIFTSSTKVIEEQKNQISSALTVVIEDIKELRANKPIIPNESVNKDRQFNLEVDKKEFPELSEFTEVIFEVLEEDENFNSSIYEIEWQNVILKEKVPGQVYLLNLFGDNSKESLLVKPILKGGDLAKAKQLFTDYSQRLDTKIAKEKELEQKLADAKKRFQEELKRQKEARVIREKMAKQKKKQAKFKEIIVMSFEVAQFGTWNCDSPIKQPKGKTVNATFASLAGAPIVLGAVYLIEKNRNSIFTYDVAQFNNLKFNPKETNTLIGFTLDDEIAIFRSVKFESVKERKHEFKMEIKNAVDMSVEKLKKMILSR
ncbi:MAG: hypothetical protein P8M12_08570 [Flavobacteriales bacterium]|nr:hypothetical protein [Flavobacteriales bacterium]